VTTAQSSLACQVGAVAAAMTDLRRADDRGPIRVSQLAELMDLSLAVTRGLHRLEAEGLVSRRPDPADRRASRFVATSQGKDARAGIQAAMCEEPASVLAAWAEADRHVLAELMPRLVRDMRAGPPGLAAQGQA
jgi:DNA-binding MarR family transcriptional regulator